MISIYLENNKNYDFNGDMILTPRPSYLDYELNGLNTITVEHPKDAEGRWKYIQGDRVVKIEAPNKQEMLYRINDIDRDIIGAVIFTAVPLMQDLEKSVLIDCRPSTLNGQATINKILEGTKFKGHSNISMTNTSHLIRKNRLEALLSDDENSFVSKFGGEVFTTGFDIWINDRIGSDKGVKFSYGKDIIDFKENINWDEVLTRVYPVGYDGITLENTGYVDSSNINKYQEIKEGFIEFSDIKVKENPEDEEGFNTIEEARAEMIKRTKELFENGLDTPNIEMDIEVAKLENTLDYVDFKDLLNVGLGDDVTIKIKHLGINIKTRVIAYQWDLVKKKFTNIKVGTYINNFLQNQADVENTLGNITNGNGTVNAQAVQGVLNAINVQMKAMREIAQDVPVRALICEDKVKGSPTYGAMCFGSMGFMIASEMLPDNSDWNWRTFGTGKGFFADLIVSGTMLADRIRGGVLESIDGSIQIDLTNAVKGIQLKKNGHTAIDISGNQVKLYDWEGSSRKDPIGIIYSGRRNGDANKTIMAIGNELDSCIAIVYKNGTTYQSYVDFDKQNKLGNGYAVYFRETTYLADAHTGYLKCLGIQDKNYVDSKFFCDSGRGWASTKNLHANGNITCGGTINGKSVTPYAVMDSENYYLDTCMEIFTVCFNEETMSYTRIILLEDEIQQSINTNDYIVEIYKVGWGDFRIVEQTNKYFIIESDRADFTFKYTIKGKRKGFENLRLGGEIC